ncbi:hypothetical protein NDU88_000878 [Pleurodeles waltl]|uniref:Uncharacterized protein n=1 Tax=Pleurodeles waltl TaxID=8319 RepID=A0AAV7KR48_PLEWA|nr:hypothetical protein NDU88_000878 [Pleurodeles waltl]
MTLDAIVRTKAVCQGSPPGARQDQENLLVAQRPTVSGLEAHAAAILAVIEDTKAAPENKTDLVRLDLGLCRADRKKMADRMGFGSGSDTGATRILGIGEVDSSEAAAKCDWVGGTHVQFASLVISFAHSPSWVQGRFRLAGYLYAFLLFIKLTTARMHRWRTKGAPKIVHLCLSTP